MWPSIDWNSFLQSMVPPWWRKERFLRWLHVLISQVRELHTTSSEVRTRILYEMSFTGQTMSLEGALNDRFDPDARGIYIDNPPDPVQTFIFRKAELATPTYIYRKWNSLTYYLSGQYSISKGGVWKAVNDNTGSGPSLTNADWSYEGPLLHIRRKDENQLDWDFVIMVPVEVVFNESEMRALVNRYRLAPKRYTIMTY